MTIDHSTSHVYMKLYPLRSLSLGLIPNYFFCGWNNGSIHIKLKIVTNVYFWPHTVSWTTSRRILSHPIFLNSNFLLFFCHKYANKFRIIDTNLLKFKDKNIITNFKCHWKKTTVGTSDREILYELILN